MRIFGKKKSLKILFVASEAAPFVKVGGLGEVMRSLPKALRSLGHDARVFLPKYATIDSSQYKFSMEVPELSLGSGDKDPYGILVSNVLKHEDGDESGITYLLENMEYYEKRANVYGYADDTTRWVLLSKAALEFVRRSKWKPDIIVASDWQTGFIPNLARTDYKDDPVLSKIPIVFSIHNLRYQGIFDPKFVSEMDYDSGHKEITDFFDAEIKKLNGMLRGIMYADAINTVSPTYAREILGEEFGEGLDDLLNERKSRLFGILNGIDVESFNPETDKELAENFSLKTIERRSDNKIALQKQFGITEDKDTFVMAMVSRLDEQKGFGLVSQALKPLMENIDFQFIVMGEGDPYFRAFFEELKDIYPERVGTHFTFDSRLPRMIFGGADAILMPSKFEPSGLVQMEAMRYGCIPIVRKVGGLNDSVEDFTPEEEKGCGFVFDKFDPFSLTIAVIRAAEIYRQKKEWKKVMKHAMMKDFSWEKSAKEYLKLFESATRFNKENQ